MSSTALVDDSPRFRVLGNHTGRQALWPAHKPIPAGWRELQAAAPREECLDYVRRSAIESPSRDQRPAARTIDFGLLFFGGDEGEAAADKYEMVIEAARFADEAGFSAVWLPERHFTAMGSLYPNPAVLHAALARETRRIRLRAGSVVLPLHNPIRVAEEWAVVDNLSKGRVELSFAPGWNAEDFALHPDRYARRYETMYQNILLVEKLWSGQSIEATDGGGQPIRIRTYPTPVQKQLIVWITAAGSPRSFQQAGAIGANVLTHLFDQGVEELAEKIALYRRARAEHGFDPEAGRVAVTLHTYLADDPEEVQRNAHRPYCDYLKKNTKLLEKLAESRNVPVALDRLTPAQLDAAIEWAFEKFLRQRSLMGTPDSCTELVSRLLDIGVQEIACLLDFGPTPQAILQGLPRLRSLMERFRGPASAAQIRTTAGV
jgi:natural product biosynthesis luciferase-like monooxygenase protein